MQKKEAQVTLIISADIISIQSLDQFNIGLEIYNLTDIEVDFNISETKLYVNSELCVAWDLAVQNGTLINLRIPPHKTRTIEWPIGFALFDTPGFYKLKLYWREDIQEIEMQVTE